MSDQFAPYGGPGAGDYRLGQRVGELEAVNAQLAAENTWLRKRVKRYHRGSWVLGILLALIYGLRFLMILGDSASL